MLAAIGIETEEAGENRLKRGSPCCRFPDAAGQQRRRRGTEGIPLLDGFGRRAAEVDGGVGGDQEPDEG